MEINLKYTLVLSIIIHLSIFMISPGFKHKKVLTVVFPVDFISLPSAGSSVNAPIPQPQSTVVTEEKEKEIIKEEAIKDVVATKTIKTVKKEKLKKKGKIDRIVDKIIHEEETKIPPTGKDVSGYGTGKVPGFGYGSIPGLGPGSSLSLDTAKFPYTYYLNTIRKKISDNWAYTRSTGNLKAIVYFKIRYDGKVDDIKIYESSGNKIFDNYALRAVLLSSPFPHLPDGYNEEYLGVYFVFRYE
jgi:TonB family protein